MKKLITLLLTLLVAYLGYQQQHPQTADSTARHADIAVSSTASRDSDDALIADAFRTQRSDVAATVSGTVSKILSDDNDGSRHQRFIIKLASGQTLFVAHNIDLAGRVDNLHAGDTIALRGEYEWNNKGGVLHWTHRDPAGKHATGWIKHDGHLYQ